MSADALRIDLPRKAGFILARKARWKVLYGGRDAAKSHSVFRAALARGAQQATRFLVCRELQASIEHSAHKLLSDLIAALGLGHLYEVKHTTVVGRPGGAADGTSFAFAGLRHNVDELKSYEGVDVAIVEEAANVSRHSWDTLENTIRKPGSELWVVFNPELESDETHQRLVIRPPEDSIVVHMTWRDNPWPSQVLAAGRERMRQERPADYECIWEGQARTTLAEGIYAEEMMAAQREGRICNVPYDPSAAVHTFWDLGFGNHTSIWVGQKVGVEWRMLRFVEDSNKFLPYYVAELQKLPYVWGTDFLPHDGGSKHVQGDSAEQQLKAAGRTVEVLTNDAIDTGINACRAVFPSVYFDRDGCADGIQHLRHYRWKTTHDGIVMKRDPLHDEHSDGADAFRSFGMARNRPAKKAQMQRRPAARQRLAHSAPSSGAGGWMAG